MSIWTGQNIFIIIYVLFVFIIDTDIFGKLAHFYFTDPKTQILLVYGLDLYKSQLALTTSILLLSL